MFFLDPPKELLKTQLNNWYFNRLKLSLSSIKISKKSEKLALISVHVLETEVKRKPQDYYINVPPLSV
jgi:hypothetical protein